ncbi:MAG: MFS transporter, partial [Alphaproteobacteria bacterium]
LLCFCSSAGQTYFISLFGGEVRAEFGLTNAGFGSIYAVGTLASAATLIWIGRLIDRVPLPVVAAGVLGMLGTMCLLMGAVWGVATVTVAIFGLRLFGQGLAVHTAMTAMARYFEAERGRAISIAALGNAAGAALAPIIVVAALAIFDWRTVWIITGAGLILLVPVALLLLSGHAERDRALRARSTPEAGASRDRTLGQALRDVSLWLLLPALLAPSFISTGLIFHQVHLAAVKGWPLSLLAGSFFLYAAASVTASIIAGPLVDRWSARRLTPFFLTPLALSCIVLVLSDAHWAAPAFLALLGTSTGVTAVVKGAIWAELYGTAHLGSIRAFGQSAMVFSSGLAPAAMGVLIDIDISMGTIAAGSAVYCLGASLLVATLGRPGTSSARRHQSAP